MKTRRSRGSRGSRGSRSKHGGWGGWWRQTAVGRAWNVTKGNHFALSKSGVPAGKPIPVPEFWGPGIRQANRLIPPLKINALSKSGGGGKRSTSGKRTAKRSRTKKGGFVFGGFPQDIKTGLANIKIGAENWYRGLMGTNQLVSASPWNQPGLNAKVAHHPTQKLIDIKAIQNAANAKVAKIH